MLMTDFRPKWWTVPASMAQKSDHIYLSVCLLCLFLLVSLVEITIRVDESECLSMASSHDQETERFLSTGTTGRRVSFNEAALFDHGKKAQEKGRRSESQHRSPRLLISMLVIQR